MKKLSTTFILALGLAGVTFAQTFSLSPSPVQTLVTSATLDTTAENEIINLEGVTKTLRWTRTEICMNPAGVKSKICDLNTCYTAAVSTKEFDLEPNQTGPIIVHFVNTTGQEGSGIIHLKMVNIANPADSTSAIYLFNACSTVGANEVLPVANVNLFPNPVVESFTLGNDQDVAFIRVFGIDGRWVASFNGIPGSTYSIADQPAGNYIISLEDEQGRIFQAIEIHKQ